MSVLGGNPKEIGSDRNQIKVTCVLGNKPVMFWENKALSLSGFPVDTIETAFPKHQVL